MARQRQPSCHHVLEGLLCFPKPCRERVLAEPQLSVRSAKARDLAHRLARRERRSVADIVERALESYEVREAGREPAAAFYARLTKDFGTDTDLEAIIRENRIAHRGPKL